MNHSLQSAIDRQRARHGDAYLGPNPDDVAAFGPYYHGACVEIETTYGGGQTHRRRGYIGLTTGWAPSFLLLSRRNSRGSSDLISVAGGSKIVAVFPQKQYA